MKLFRKNKHQSDLNEEAFSPIQRIKKIEGKLVPAFICNGGTYFFTDIEVYSDGIIEAWGALDLDFFRSKLASNWIAVNVPNEENISIHHLASLKITDCIWRFDSNTFYDFVVGLLKGMNSKMQNLYNFFGEDTVQIGTTKYSKLPRSNGKPVRPGSDHYHYHNMITGRNYSVFFKEAPNIYYLVNISVFEDQSVIMDRLPAVIRTDIPGLKKMMEDQEVITEISRGSKVMIYGLGEFVTEEVNAAIKVESLFGEIEDAVSELNSKPTTSQTCKSVYDDYLQNPTVQSREVLREAYEKVPEHLKVYILGDMDVKDIPIRMIIYGEEEIKKWNHYIIAVEKGYELPKINVPNPVDEI
ncbi:MAG: DUF7638 domain-containing protein [Lewinella sp.]|uniref:DUF7638 domain-containing protein n=1 Tax=Lewinella sp. TaxID=2004506 RepID=UPI003D6B83F1